jgi:hypothetical protein
MDLIPYMLVHVVRKTIHIMPLNSQKIPNNIDNMAVRSFGIYFVPTNDISLFICFNGMVTQHFILLSKKKIKQ